MCAICFNAMRDLLASTDGPENRYARYSRAIIGSSQKIANYLLRSRLETLTSREASEFGTA